MNYTNCGTPLDDGVAKCGNCGNTAERNYSYDYKTVETDLRSSSEVLDSYESLGWDLAGRSDGIMGGVVLNFKRSRKIKNKERLNRVQVRLDDSLECIKVYEKGKSQSATAAAVIIGIIGALLLGTGMSFILAFGKLELWQFIASIILGVAGMAVCGLAYLAYVKMRAKNTSKMDVLIDKKHDEIAGLCEEAQRLKSEGCA